MDKKMMFLVVVAVLLSDVSAYNKSLTDSKKDITPNNFVGEFTTVLNESNNQELTTQSANIGSLFVVGIYAAILALIILAFKRIFWGAE